MKLAGYLFKTSDTVPVSIYEDQGFYYIKIDSNYNSIGNQSFVNKYFKNKNLQICKIN
ncbi:MAG: hypothetical protein LBV03_01670 [Fusobacteriales bacterium]|jgi:hypothetical protein|nr:hypothetical protein [Fusobacteriales bacterium]